MSEDSATETSIRAESSGARRPATMGSLLGWVAAYTLARLALVAAVTAVIIGVGRLVGVDVYFLAAVAFGVLIALPLGMVLFKKIRLKVNAQIAEVDADRAAKRSDLQSRLRGDDE